MAWRQRSRAPLPWRAAPTNGSCEAIWRSSTARCRRCSPRVARSAHSFRSRAGSNPNSALPWGARNEGELPAASVFRVDDARRRAESRSHHGRHRGAHRLRDEPCRVHGHGRHFAYDRDAAPPADSPAARARRHGGTREQRPFAWVLPIVVLTAGQPTPLLSPALDHRRCGGTRVRSGGESRDRDALRRDSRERRPPREGGAALPPPRRHGLSAVHVDAPRLAPRRAALRHGGRAALHSAVGCRTWSGGPAGVRDTSSLSRRLDRAAGPRRIGPLGRPRLGRGTRARRTGRPALASAGLRRESVTARTWTAGVERRVLPNGLTILVQRDASAPVVAVITHVRAGFFDEPDRWLGISHVLEHMFFKGTPTRGVGEIARATKAAGGYLNAHTSYDHTAYYVVLPARELAAALDIQSDALRNSVLEEAELARELQVIIQEARRKLDTPSSVTHEVLHEVMYDRHRIRRWRIGHEAQLATFRRADVAGYYESRYVPSRTIMAI